ncbi:MAG: hypothetical protein HY265_02720 [Deltaproteobacteria bacterium]|nr:hypothetical protein [Deltaproteobacteria bacterium]
MLGALGAIAGFVIGRAAAIYVSRGCFDVWDNSARGEFFFAYLLKILSPKIRFQTWFRFAHWFGGPAAEFPPKIGLTGLDDSDTTVRDSYIGWFQRKRPWGCFANAVAVVLGAGVNAEKALADRLQRNYNEFDTKRQRDLFVTDEKDYWEELKEPWGYFPTGIPWPKSIEDAEGNFRIWYHNNEQRLYFRGRMTEQERDELLLVSTNSLYQKAVNGLFAQSQKEGYVVEWHGAALSYMTCLALAWMHTKRRKDAGSPIPPEIGLPDPPDLSSPLSLPPAAVPQMVIDAAQNGIITLPLDAIQRDLASGPGAPDADLFKDPAPPSKPKEDPPPQPKEHVPQLIIDKTVTVKESDGDVDTGIDIQEFDIVEIEATGEIWAGVWFTGKNDADGWNGIDHDKKFPLHTGSFARPFCLLGKWGEKIIVPGLISVTYWKGDYFFVGKKESPLLGKKSFKTVYIGPSRGLILRTNDDTPGNGSGEFSCHIQVWR